MERNLELYAAYQAARNLIFWLPVFFLYFASVVGPAEVLLLESIYYAGVVVLEVPSGYLSDRLGRRPTLLIAMTCWVAAGVLFATTASFVTFAAAQLLLAAGMAFNSGTDSALLYDSLASLDRASEFGEREGRAQSHGFVALGISALVGGALAGFDLRLAYILFAAASVAALVIALSFTEPKEAGHRAEAFGRQLRVVARRIRRPVLGWLFAFAVAMTVFNHVPYMFFQPYLEFVVGDVRGEYAATPLATGASVAAMMLISAFVSRRAMRVGSRFGIAATLMGAMALQGAIIGGMAVALHPAIVALIVLRSVPSALMGPLIGATVHPELEPGFRATYLSVQSLAGRLAFSLSLLAASYVAQDLAALTPARMSEVLLGYLVALLTSGLALAAFARVLPPRRAL